MRFSLGVNYWPARSATAMWHRFDAGEIAADFAHVAALGFDTVRFFLRWDAFAPEPASADPVMLDRFAQVLDAAAGAGVRAVPALFCGHMSGVNYLPAWALDRRRPRGAFRTFTGDAESPFGCGDLYGGPLLDAQLAFARAAGERVREHPALYAWDIGHRFSDVCEPPRAKVVSGEHASEPAAERAVAAWSRRLTEALEEHSGRPATAGTHAGDVLADRNVRLGSLCAPFAFASMHGDPVHLAFARSRLDPEAIALLALLAASFSYKPVVVTALGAPSCPPGKFSAFEHFAPPGTPEPLVISEDDTAFATYPCLTEHETAAYATAVLDRLHADGRLGAYWWCWSDYGEAWRDVPPFDLAPHERRYGIVRSDGSEKPVAAALAAFAAEAREVRRTDDMPMISSTYYYRTLPVSTRTLYDAFLGAVRARRG